MVDIVEHLKPDDGRESVYVWFDTGIEMAATKRHLKYLQERYGIEIHTESGHKKVAAAVLSDGYPFMNKVVSEYIDRLQTHDFQWEDKPFVCFAKNTQTAKQPCGGGATTGEANRTSRSKQKLHPEAG